MVMGRNECGSNAMVTGQMTVEEYLEMKSRQETKEVTTKQKNLVYGLEGIKTLFGCSTTTAWRIKSHPKARPGITDTIQEMMRVYYKKYPEAKEFVEKCCELGMPDRA